MNVGGEKTCHPRAQSGNQKIAGLYIHIPFCRTKCLYCSFYSETNLSLLAEFLEALFREMEMTREQFQPLDTVYIGGGTPSVLSPHQIQALLERTRHYFQLTTDVEITLEANPADLDSSYLQFLRHCGIHRIHLGIQSFNPETLTFLGRRHTPEQATSSILAAREAGFDHIGIDLIYGLPGQSMESWLDTLKKALDYAPEHVSCYQLSIEAGTPLAIREQRGEFSLPPEDLQYDFFFKTSATLEAAGYTHYEVSNFARGMKYASRHNQKYWDHTPYLGLGPSAHSFQGNRRWWNHRSLDRYMAELTAGKVPVQSGETLDREQLGLEAFFLALRTNSGLHLKNFSEQFQRDLFAEKGPLLTNLLEGGYLVIQNGMLKPTRSGLAVADLLALI